jgi:serine protease inhibitor ecotin
MAGGIADPEVGFNLRKAHGRRSVRMCPDQQLTEQLSRHDLGGTLVKGTVEHWGV